MLFIFLEIAYTFKVEIEIRIFMRKMSLVENC